MVQRAARRLPLDVGATTAFRSSAAVTRSFCGTCGTPLCYANEDFPDEVDITICSLDDPERLPPKDHTRTAEKLRWDVPGDGLTAYPGKREG